MMTVVARIITMLLLGWVVGLWCATPSRAFKVGPPTETLGRLHPGETTVQEAIRLYGPYDIAMAGQAAYFAGGARGTKAYCWTPGSTLGLGGLTIETLAGSSVINLVMVDAYPGIVTSHGLMALVPERTATDLYGIPDYAFEWQNSDTRYRELYYIDQGLLLISGLIPGRSNWTVTKIILTYPTYLANAVSVRYANTRGWKLQDITTSYRVWARKAGQPA